MANGLYGQKKAFARPAETNYRLAEANTRPAEADARLAETNYRLAEAGYGRFFDWKFPPEVKKRLFRAF